MTDNDELDASQLLDEYLKNAVLREEQKDSRQQETTTRRIECCNTSRSIYCSECYNILLPQQEELDDDLSKLELPFHIDIILGIKENRKDASGIHMMVLAKAIKDQLKKKNSKTTNHHEEEGDNNNNEDNSDPPTTISERPCDVRLYELQDNNLPSYENTDEDEKTYVLFPDPTSSVPDNIGGSD